jgi:streptogramin lyase
MRNRQKSLPLFVVLLMLAASASGQTITEFPLPEGAQPERIIAGPDGNLWFTVSADGPHVWYEWGPETTRIGRMTPAGIVTLFPSRARSFHFPTDLTAGADGNVWVVHLEGVGGDGAINRVTPSGEVTELLWAGAYRITAGPDGNLWFTDLFRDIGRMTTAGQVTYFPAPQTAFTSDITTGPDGNLWFTYSPYSRLARVGRMTPAGVVTEFEVPTLPGRIISGPDGNLWFTTEGSRIARMTTSGVVTEFAIPGSAFDLIAAPDGNIWFLYADVNRIGRMTTNGTLLEDITIPGPAFGLTGGPDGAVWYTRRDGGRIGRIALAPEPAIDSRILPVVGSTAGVGGSFFRTSVQLHNATGTTIAGRIVFHPPGVSGSASDPALSYTLSPGQTQSIPDLLPAMGRSGLGSADIEVTSGSAPAATVRVFNDAGAAGTTGFTEEPMRSEEALRPGSSGVLLLPADVTRFRFNLGVRTLESGGVVTVTLRDASGAAVATVSRAFPATYHLQQSATELLGVPTLPPGGSISITVGPGSAIFYGASVDNVTGDPSLQIARVAP